MATYAGRAPTLEDKSDGPGTWLDLFNLDAAVSLKIAIRWRLTAVWADPHSLTAGEDPVERDF